MHTMCWQITQKVKNKENHIAHIQEYFYMQLLVKFFYAIFIRIGVHKIANILHFFAFMYCLHFFCWLIFVLRGNKTSMKVQVSEKNTIFMEKCHKIRGFFGS